MKTITRFLIKQLCQEINILFQISTPLSDQHAPYFVTCTVVHWIDLFSRKDYKDILVDSLNYCIEHKHLILYAWVIMTNHIHLAARCDPPGGMSAFLRDYKKFTSKKLIDTMGNISDSRKEWLLDKFSFEAKRTRRTENYKVWRDDNYAIDLGHIDLIEKVNYIHNNPVRAGLVDFPRGYVGEKGLVKVTVI